MSDPTRLVELETQLAHLQRLFDDLNEVVTKQSQEIVLLRRANKRLTEKFEQVTLSLQDRQGVDPLDEKPPHY